MTAASYVSDLSDIFLFESTTGLTAFGGGSAGLAIGVDFAMEGTYAVDKQISSTTGSVRKGFVYDNTTNFSIGADDHFYVWSTLATPGLASHFGIRMGDDANSNVVDFAAHEITGGNPKEIGGEPYAVRYHTTLDGKPGFFTAAGSPSATPSWIGGFWVLGGPAKGPNAAADGARMGSGYDITGGTGADDPANFSGIASDDESTSQGVFQSSDAGYLLQGKLRIGSSGTACEFEDSDKFIAMRITKQCLDDFSEILIENASSILTLDNITFRGLDTLDNWNLGRFEMVTSTATVDLTGVVFQDFGDTVLGTGATCLNCAWINTSTVTANGADLSGSLIRDYEETVNTSPLIWNTATDPQTYLDGMTITKGTIS